MSRLSLSMVTVLAISVMIAACSQAPAASPTQPPAPKAAEPTKAAAPAAAQPTAAPAAAAPKVTWPEKGKTISLIVPWPAGGGTDIGARVLAAGMEKELGIPVQVVNKAGAGSQLGITDLTQAKPDGYTLAYVSLPGGLVTYLDPDRKAVYTRKSIQPLFLHSTEPGTIAVKSDSVYKSVAEMITAAKTTPNSVKMAIAGIMTAGHLQLVQLEQLTGAKFSLVQFDGAAPAMTAVAGGHVDGYISSLSDPLPAVKGGNARILGVADNARSPILPDVKTYKEQGFDMTGYLSTGVIAPAGTPKEALTAISSAAKRVMDTAEHKQKLVDIGKDARYQDVPDFEKFWDDLEAQTAKLMPLAKAGAK